jgi:hypothetical protein
MSDQMTQDIYLKCMENCTSYYQYKFDNNNILALTGQWRNDESKGGIWIGLLPTKPKIDEEYELTLRGPLKINTIEDFWVLYLDPYSTHEGMESDDAIRNFTICLCRQVEVLEIQDRNVCLSVKVLQVKSIEDSVNIPKNEYNVITSLDDHVTSRHYHVENFESFSLLVINCESDIGWTYIVSKKDNKSTIVAENSWDFHQNIWKLINEELTDEQEKRYGIQHSIVASGG